MPTTTTDPRTRRSDLPCDDRGHRLFDQHVPGIPGNGDPIILDTEDSRGLTFTWYDISRRDTDWQSRERGYLVSRLEVTDHAGHLAGFLNITHTTPELVAAELPTPFHWAAENSSGTSIGYRWRDGVTLEQLWAAAHVGLRITPPSLRGRSVWVPSASDAPTDPKVLAAELDAVEARFAKQMADWQAFLTIPFVDYALLSETVITPTGTVVALRGTGVGQRMYTLAARKLAEYGKVLRASGIQSESATAIWARLTADPNVPTHDIQVPNPRTGEPDTHVCIDYRTDQPV